MVVGFGGVVLHTTDGGTTWTSQNSGITSDLRGLALADPTHIWAVGDRGMIVYTTTGGE